MMKKRKYATENDGPDEDQEICKLSSKRKVSFTVWKGVKMLNIREYYVKDGKELPSAKGICLPIEQWKALRKKIRAIDIAFGIEEGGEEEEVDDAEDGDEEEAKDD